MIKSLAFWLPQGASTLAGFHDKLYLFVCLVAVFFFAIVTLGTFFLVFRYRRRGDWQLTCGKAHNTALEIFWSIIPGILTTIIFFWGFFVYMKAQIAPANAIEVRVTASQFQWNFTYNTPDGMQFDSPKLVVPAHMPVKLIMQSRDVIHSLYIPNFRVKMDVLPNRYSSVWFEATEENEYPLYCTEFCGNGHSVMNTTVEVVTESTYRTWLLKTAEESSSMHPGKKIYRQLCSGCHSLDGSKMTGPSFAGVYGKEEQFADGSTGVVDDNYIRESVLNPQAKVVAGYPENGMNSFAGQLSDEDISNIIDFIKTLEDK